MPLFNLDCVVKKMMDHQEWFYVFNSEIKVFNLLMNFDFYMKGSGVNETHCAYQFLYKPLFSTNTFEY